MFQLNQEEIPNDYLKSQFVTLNESGNKRGLHIKKMPYAFTEQGLFEFLNNPCYPNNFIIRVETTEAA
jgi:hypothetical protein